MGHAKLVGLCFFLKYSKLFWGMGECKAVGIKTSDICVFVNV